MGRLEGKIAIVTGGGRGIGRATVELLRAEGAAVVAWDRDPPAEEEPERPVERVDVSSGDDVRAAADRAAERHGGIDLLVNNAGINLVRQPGVRQLMMEEWSRVLDVNLTGAVRCVQAVLPHMLTRGGGRIVNLSSIYAVRGFPGQTAYAASKAGVLGITRVWAHELGPAGITVNAIVPGYIDTAMNNPQATEFRRMVMARTPLRRLGTAEEVARACLFLVSDEASFITGVALPVDGGLGT